MIDKEVDFNQYKVIILPDRIKMKKDTYQKLQDFVNAGGKLLASGESVINENGFVFDFGAEYEGKGMYIPSYAKPVENNPNNTDYIMYSECEAVKIKNGAELVKVINPYFNRTNEHFCSHYHTPSSGNYGGTGMVEGKAGIYISWKIFEDYAIKGELIAKRLVCMALDRLLGDKKTLETDLGSAGIVNLLKQEDRSRYVAHLLYATPVKRGENIEAIEEIYPVYDVKIKLQLPEKVEKVYLAPQREEVSFKKEGEYISLNIKKIDCHQMVVFEIK